MLKPFLVIFFCLFFSFSKAQNNTSISFAGGYKSNYGTATALAIGVDITRRIKFEIGPAFHYKYSGIGGTAGMHFSVINGKKVKLTLNADYQYLFQRSLSIVENKTSQAIFQVPSMSHVFGGVSLAILVKTLHKQYNKDRLSFTVNYGVPLNNYKPQFISGVYNQTAENKVANHINAGIGFSIAYTAYLFY